MRPTEAQIMAARLLADIYREEGWFVPVAVQRIAETAMPHQSLDDALAELERTDPKVRASAQSLAETVWRVTHPEDVANPFQTPPTPETPAERVQGEAGEVAE